ncbi:MAG: Hpt domain-containing protein [Zoogloeaceae bacterium]|jgi:chemosensory pili system protein ChpA (sensor histidine kinase/response regulator)|nr:Hpt domain-containing protein [Zoogloeaceae bacterium]
MIGLYGVDQVVEALDGLMAVLETQDSANAAALDTLQQAIQAVQHYLDGLLVGEANQPLRLFLPYRALMQAQGKKAEPADLFFPELSVPVPPHAAVSLAPDAIHAQIHAERVRFQRGMLDWLRQPSGSAAWKSGLLQMQEAIQAIEAMQSSAAVRGFWRAALGVMVSLVKQANTEDDARHICVRIDLQIRHLLEGDSAVAERLQRDALYFVARSAGEADSLLAELQGIYHLKALLPTAEQLQAVTNASQEHTLRRLKEHISSAEEQWNRYCSGSVSSLAAFTEQTNVIVQLTAQLGNSDLNLLTQALHAVAAWLVKQPAHASDGISMEIATALILIQNAQEHFALLGQDFPQQARLMAQRLTDCAKGLPLSSDVVPLLDEISRRAQDRLLMAQVVREVLNNLTQIEQDLDAYFRDPAAVALDFKALEESLHQVSGALAMLGHDAAVAYLDDCKTLILTFNQTETPDTATFEEVAQRLAVIAFFVESLQNSVQEFQSFVQRLLDPAAAAAARAAAEKAKASALVTTTSVEQQLERLKSETRSVLEAVKSNPGDVESRHKLEQHLLVLQKNADLVGDQTLLAQIEAALATLRTTGSEQAAQIAQVEETLAPAIEFAPESQPSAETLQLAQSSDDEVDAELLDIFLEEAEEVLGSIEENLGALRQQPHDLDTMTTIRRGSHTLKGSGRMVGLKELGEVAWAVEQTLNLWLNQKQEATPELLEMIERVHRIFSEWIIHLRARDGLAPAYTSLVALAEHLRGGSEVRLGGASSASAQEAGGGLGEPQAGTSSEALLAPVEPLVLKAQEVPANPDTESNPETTERAEAGSEPDEKVSVDSHSETLGFDLHITQDSEAYPESETSTDSPDLAGAAVLAEAAQAEYPEVEQAEYPEAAQAEYPEAAQAEYPEAAQAEYPEAAQAEYPEAAQAEYPEAAQAEYPEAVQAEYPDEAPKEWGEVVLDAKDFSFASDAAEERAPVVSGAEAAKEEEVAKEEDSEISPQLFQIFQGEAQTYMDRLNAFIVDLVATPMMPTPYESHRAAHTLAGIAGTLGFMPVHDLSRGLELALVRRGDTQHPDALEGQEVMRQTVEALGRMLGELERGRMPTAETTLIAALEELYPSPVDSDTVEVESVSVARSAPVPTSNVASPLPFTLRDLPKDALVSDLLPIFMSESVDLLDSLYTQVKAWREAPDEDAPPRALARVLHTLKGSARMAGAMCLGLLVHETETQVDMLAAQGKVSAVDLGGIEAACDIMARVIDAYQAGNYDVGAEFEALTASARTFAIPEETVATSVLETPDATAVEPLFPPLGDAPQEDAGQEAQAATRGRVELEARAQLRVRADLVDRLVNEAGEMAISRARIEGEMRDLKESLLNLTDNVIRLRGQLREIEIQAETRMQAGAEDKDKAGFDPLELDRFTRFQELTRMMAESVNDVGTVQQNLLKNLDDADAAIVAQARLNRSLQQSLMSVRMVPFDSQSGRLQRLVRQIARELDKSVHLEIVGGQFELDRFVLEKVFSPLEHMVRNAIAHGLEGEAERVAKGKPVAGQIRIVLKQEGNEIILALSDDGLGLDLQRIREKAEQKGLIAPDAQIDDQQLMDFIFHSGFSTAERISQVAGRGIGMDVVKAGVTELGGRIEVWSEAGQGTAFRLYLPLTLAVTQTVIVRGGGRIYAIPANMVEQVMEVREKALGEIHAQGEALWQNHHYPFHYLPRLLGDTVTQLEQRTLYWVMLLRSGTQRVAVLLDDLIGTQEIVVKNVGPQMARVVGVSGATVLGDGQIALILNPVALAMRERTVLIQGGGVVAQAQNVPVPARQPVVMVVDDSLTVRKITQKLLTREGYQVELAKDGQDALEHLAEVVPDVIISDIEMPRMDGFDLVRHIRADDRFVEVPIIMITSRTAEKHRNYAIEIGANQYLGKPYDETKLLELLAGYTEHA